MIRARDVDYRCDETNLRGYWQVIAYGNTLHGFTNPAADGSIMRTALYNEQADRRSWASMKSLFDEVLT